MFVGFENSFVNDAKYTNNLFVFDFLVFDLQNVILPILVIKTEGTLFFTDPRPTF